MKLERAEWLKLIQVALIVWLYLELEKDRKPLTQAGFSAKINDNEATACCADADGECRAKDPAKCRVHGEKDVVNKLEKDFAEINKQIKELINKGVINPHIGEAKKAVPAKIESVNKHALKHGVTLDDAQGFIDNAVVMFDQSNRFLFVSHDGNAVLLDKEKRLISAYRKAQFDVAIKAILEVLENG